MAEYAAVHDEGNSPNSDSAALGVFRATDGFPEAQISVTEGADKVGILEIYG